MRSFLIKILKAMVFFLTLVVGVYFVLQLISKTLNTYDRDCIFVWGDSQMHVGLDVSLLGDKMEKQVLTSAHHGSGVYDFLVSQKNMPDNATCIVSFPEAAFFRNPSDDYNRRGFEIKCLYELYLSGCPINECVRVFNLNKRLFPYKVYSSSCNRVIPFADNIAELEYLPGYCSLFDESKDWFPWKANAYIKGVQHLSDKHTQIVLVQFPFENQVELCAQNSINRHLSDSLKRVIIDEYAMKYDTVALHSDSLLMYDLAHLNEVGARMLTCRIADSLRKDTVNNRFFTVVIE